MKTFRSFMKDNFVSFLKFKIALNYSPATYIQVINGIDDFLYENYRDAVTFTDEMFVGYLMKKKHQSPRSISQIFSTVRSMSLYLNSKGIECYIPYDIKLAGKNAYNPCIVNDEQLRKLFDAIDGYKSPPTSPSHLHIVMPVLFRLEFTCGLRPGEPLNLRCEDVDLDNGIISIRNTKNHKSRRIAMSDDMLSLLRKYEKMISELVPDREFFFVNRSGDKISVNIAGLEIIKARRSIDDDQLQSFRCYDFRNNFATRSILKMTRDGVEPHAYIAKLSAYMGHESFADTFYYISLIPELLVSNKEINWDYANSALEEVKF